LYPSHNLPSPPEEGTKPWIGCKQLEGEPSNIQSCHMTAPFIGSPSSSEKHFTPKKARTRKAAVMALAP
jgi:hypothetical protein